MSQPANRRQGEFATNVVADTYGLVVENDDADWYDAVHPNSEAKTECKSARRELADGSTGRYRLWEDQHRSLVASDASGTAWYGFVLLDDDGTVVDVQRRKPATVGAIVRDRGGWNQAGHSKRESRQHKLPWSEVINA